MAGARQTALAQALALAGDEAASVEFILQCQFAEARLEAAQHIRSERWLKYVAERVRDTDRRVARLMQQRLDTITQRSRRQQRATQCIEQARALAAQACVLPNQLVELDRHWQATGVTDTSLQEAFAAVRSALQQRLEEQMAIQRRMIDLRGSLSELASAVEAGSVSRDVLAGQLDEAERNMAQSLARPEAASLPRHLPDELHGLLASLRQAAHRLEHGHAALEMRRQALSRWEAAPAETLRIDELKREWRALPEPWPEDAQSDQALENRFRSLLARCESGLQRTGAPGALHARQQFEAALQALEQAIADGMLQAASEHDKVLRTLGGENPQLPRRHAARLARVRAELGRLRDWAKWGGQVSREELLRMAQDLAQESPPPVELARRVGTLREHWKSLDASTGPAPRQSWEAFDAACNTAYAPAAEYFRNLSEQRGGNLAQGRAMINETRQFAAAMAGRDASEIAWKDVAVFCESIKRRWQQLGPVGRKDRKRLDGEFAEALAAIFQPLAARRQEEAVRREQLIARVEALDPGGRGTPDAVRELQQRWQALAKSMPLPHKDEQALWKNFRAACDRVYAARKELVKAADSERKENLRKRDELCAQLEAAVEMPADVIRLRLNKASQEWQSLGQVPRAEERRIGERYRRASDMLRQRLQHAQRDAMREKLAMCQALEAWLVHPPSQQPEYGEGRLEALCADWDKLPPLPGGMEQILRKRFDRAAATLNSADREYARQLERNAGELLQHVQRLEILLGIEVSSQMAAQRLKMQVELLQSSLKKGERGSLLRESLQRLCEMPAAADHELAQRIGRLLGQIKAADLAYGWEGKVTT